MKPVAELLVSLTIGDIDVAFAFLALECATFGNVVAILHRDFLSLCQRCEIDLQPSGDDTPEVDEPRAIFLTGDAAGRERVDDAVALKGLRRGKHITNPECGCVVPSGLHIGVEPFAAES